MTLFFQDSVRVLRPEAKTNRAGETELDYASLRAAAEADPDLGVPRAEVRVRAQTNSELVTADRTSTISTWRIATAPFSADWDLLPTDWLRLPTGELVTVEGEVQRGYDPITNRLHHVEVNVRKVLA